MEERNRVIYELQEGNGGTSDVSCLEEWADELGLKQDKKEWNELLGAFCNSTSYDDFDYMEYYIRKEFGLGLHVETVEDLLDDN